jgi:nitroreductase
MDAFTTFQSRYSCREYLDKPVPRELLERIIDAGRRGPSARKVEPAFFVVVTDAVMRHKLSQIAEFGRFIAQAGACVLVFSHDTKYFLEDGCIAAENVLLAATALGLQSCWVAGHGKPYAATIAELVDAPGEAKLIAMLAIGYGKSPGRQPEHKPLKDVLHWDKF